MVKVENITYKIGKKNILVDVNAVFREGEFNIILGPNGSGKSTLMKIFSGLLAPTNGKVKMGADDLQLVKKSELARYRAVLTQQADIGFPVTVEEVVMMGRYPHFDFTPSQKDFEICSEIMVKLNLADYRYRNYQSLSGGEKQRVHFARVLAQVWEKPPTGQRYLFLDEPLANLDIRYQYEFLAMARGLLNGHIIIIAILHDINQSIHFGDRLFFMREGRLINSGVPADIISEDLLKEVYGVSARVTTNPDTQAPLVIFSE